MNVEYVPDKVYMTTHDAITVKIVSTPTPPKSPAQDNTFSFFFMALTTLLLAIAVYAEGPLKSIIDIEQSCSLFDQMLLNHGIISKVGVSMDAFIAIICWGITYLYIRRLWNPETMDVAFTRFAADSFFGGLAAGGSVILKAFLVRVLVEKKWSM